MTVPIETSRVTYTGNGVTTVFPTVFYFQTSAQVRVRTTPPGDVESVLTEGVHYNVTTPTRGSGAGGSVTFLVAPVASEEVVIERDVSLVQLAALRTVGSFEPEVHEDAFDYEMMAIQEVKRDLADVELAAGSASVAAGSGLTSTGASPVTLHVGAGPGLSVNADDVEVDFGAATGQAYAGGIYDGIADTAARSDHGHDVLTGAVLDLAVGDAADPGIGTGLALAQHVHGVPAGVPVAVTKAANAEGVATTFARSDHKHDVSTAAAGAITDSTNAEGSATSLARSDHQHAHGNRGGGALHAEATTGAAGFLSAADKTSLSNIGAVALKSKIIAALSAPQSIASGLGGGAVLTGYAETLDNDNEFDPSTGVYTAKAAGNVLVLGQAISSSVAWPGGTRVYLGIRKNGSTVGVLCAHFLDTGVTRTAIVEGTRFFAVAIGDTVDLYVAHDQGGSVNFSGYLAISRFV